METSSPTASNSLEGSRADLFRHGPGSGEESLPTPSQPEFYELSIDADPETAAKLAAAHVSTTVGDGTVSGAKSAPPGATRPVGRVRALYRRFSTAIWYLLFMAVALSLLGALVWDFDWQEWFVIVVMTLLIGGLLLDFPADVCLLSSICALMLSGILSTSVGISGFSDSSIFAIALMLVVAAGLETTGVLDAASRVLFRIPKNLWQTQLIVLFPVAIMSAFVNNTPLVAILIPIIEKNVHRVGVTVSKMMMPLSFAAILGGLCSIIGTSTNLVVKGLVEKFDKDTKIGFFEVGYVGFPLVVAYFVYLMLFSGCLLPNGKPADDSAHNEANRKYTSCAFVKPNCAFCRRSINFMVSRYLPNLSVFALVRASGNIVHEPSDALTILPGDRLFVIGAIPSLRNMYSVPGLVPAFGSKYYDVGRETYVPDFVMRALAVSGSGFSEDVASFNPASLIQQSKKRMKSRLLDSSSDPQSPTGASDVDLRDADANTSVAPRTENNEDVELEEIPPRRSVSISSRNSLTVPVQTRIDIKEKAREGKYDSSQRFLVEAVVAPHSPLLHQTIRKANFRDHYGVAVVGFHRFGDVMHEMLPDIEMRVGDVLLLETAPGFVQQYRMSPEFSSVSATNDSFLTMKGKWKRIISVVVMAVVVGINTFDLMNLAPLALGGALVLVFTGCMSLERARRAVTSPFLITIACSFGLADAIQSTGVGTELGRNILFLFSWMGKPGLLAGVYVATALLSSVITNAAAVAVMFPIARSAVSQHDPALNKALYIILMLAASASFATPIGYQTNLMVAGPGGYKFIDFVRFGLPLQLIAAVISVSLTYVFFVP